MKGIHFNSYIFTGKKEGCNGCGTCSQICPKSALSMHADSEGFLYPVLNHNLCVQCGLCDMRCPEVNDHSNKDGKRHSYIATTQHENYYLESASIGICTMLSEYVINQGGIVFGCYLDETTWTAYHIGVEDMREINKIRNSKYLQSDTRDSYAASKRNLNNGRLVLYIGTPCQIAGLKSYLHKEYDNLYTIDIICHGVFSPKLMPLEIAYWEKIFGSKITNFRFRSKRVYKLTNGGMVNFDVEKKGKIFHIERFAGSSPSYHCFAYSGDGKNYNLRLSCYSCTFKSNMRYGDITVGDPWFIDDRIINNDKLESSNIIRSLYSTNTHKGWQLMQCIQSLLYQKEYPVDETFLQPAVLFENRIIPPMRAVLYDRLNKEDYGTLVERLFSCDLEEEHRIFVLSYFINAVKFYIKQIIGYKKWKK